MKLHTQYERSRLSGFREEDFIRFSYEKPICPGMWPFWPGGHNLNKLSRGPLGDNAYHIPNSGLCGFRIEYFLRFSYITLCKTYKPLGGAIFGPGVII